MPDASTQPMAAASAQHAAVPMRQSMQSIVSTMLHNEYERGYKGGFDNAQLRGPHGAGGYGRSFPSPTRGNLLQTSIVSQSRHRQEPQSGA